MCPRHPQRWRIIILRLKFCDSGPNKTCPNSAPSALFEWKVKIKGRVPHEMDSANSAASRSTRHLGSMVTKLDRLNGRDSSARAPRKQYTNHAMGGLDTSCPASIDIFYQYAERHRIVLFISCLPPSPGGLSASQRLVILPRYRHVALYQSHAEGRPLVVLLTMLVEQTGERYRGIGA